MLKVVIVVAVCAVILSLGFSPDKSISHSTVPVLGDTTYNVNILDAPVATGMKLRFLSWLLVQTPLGPALRRHLLKNNNFHNLRGLSAQIPGSGHPPLTHPVNRHPAQDIVSKSLIQEQTGKTLLESFTAMIQGTDTDVGTAKANAILSSEMHPRRTIRQYHEHYKSGKGKPSDIMQKTIQTVNRWEKQHKLVIFSAVLPEEIMTAARASDARFAAGKPLSILDGVPIAVKDMIHIKGHINFNGKSPLQEHSDGHEMPEKDDVMVGRLRELGAIIFGGTVMTEGGVTPLGWSAHFQGPYNVYNFDRYCVASGLMPAAIGFDGGGSIRIPASMSGVHGLGVTFGRVPFDIGLDTTMIKPGPLTATAEDSAIIYSAISPNEKNHFYNELYDGDKHGPPSAYLQSFYDIEDLS
eukprot:GSChrysophyteH2.ASY1.ANO1.1659.1 assembled CDS